MIGHKAIPDRTLRRWLEEWHKQGLVVRTGEGPATRYQTISPPEPKCLPFLTRFG